MAEYQVTASRDRNLSKLAVRSVTLMRPVDEVTMTRAPAPPPVRTAAGGPP